MGKLAQSQREVFSEFCPETRCLVECFRLFEDFFDEVICWMILSIQWTSIMPAGLSWTTYLTRLSIALIATACGAQAVHVYYKPVDKVYWFPCKICSKLLFLFDYLFTETESNLGPEKDWICKDSTTSATTTITTKTRIKANESRLSGWSVNPIRIWLWLECKICNKI